MRVYGRCKETEARSRSGQGARTRRRCEPKRYRQTDKGALTGSIEPRTDVSERRGELHSSCGSQQQPVFWVGGGEGGGLTASTVLVMRSLCPASHLAVRRVSRTRTVTMLERVDVWLKQRSWSEKANDVLACFVILQCDIKNVPPKPSEGRGRRRREEGREQWEGGRNTNIPCPGSKRINTNQPRNFRQSWNLFLF